MFSHLKQSPSRQLGVGAAVAFTEVVGGVQQLTKPAADAVNLALAERYPVLTGAFNFEGVPVPPGVEGANYWSYMAQPAEYFAQTGATQPAVTAADYIKSNDDAVALVDVANAKQALLPGSSVPLVFIIGQPFDNIIKGIFAGPGASSAVLSPLAGAAGKDTPAEKASYTPLLVAAAAGIGGALVGGPVVGAVAAGVGYFVASA